MRKFLMTALAVTAMVGFAAPTFAGGAVVTGHAPMQSSMVQKAGWDDCHDWDGHRHECRDKGWDRKREGEYRGEGSCRRHGHDHYFEDGHWHECHKHM
jgi:hypothetical protein